MVRVRVIAFLLITIFSVGQAFSWGQIGHRTVGLVAQKHLNKKTKKKLKELLFHESLAIISVWMDDEKSNPDFRHASDWHWVTIPEGKTYAETEKNENGDVIQTINRVISELKSDNLTKEQEVMNIKILVHLVGDIHQPLHVGTGEDIGGNAVKVNWFSDDSNLHRVWDSDMIQSKEFSYTELASSIDHVDPDIIKLWQQDDVLVWAKESMDLRPQVYNLPENKRLGYQYLYDNWSTVEKRLQQAGIRLAGILNDIYS